MAFFNKLIIAFFTVFCIIGITVNYVRAQDNSRAQDLQEEIRELEKKLAVTADTKRTLSSQITYMDSQIRLTQLQITDTQNRIRGLEEEIASLSSKINNLEVSLTQLSELLLDRISETYKKGKIGSLELLFSANDFSNFLTRFKYIQKVQTHDKLLMYQIQEAKNTFSEKKLLREKKREEMVSLENQLLSQKSRLDQQKLEKENLLRVTQNDEKKYQQLRDEALRELSQIQEAAAFLKSGGVAIKVKRGDVIGLQGNTGYSTGEHLHFGVYNYGSIDSLPSTWYYGGHVEPASVLSSRSVTWDENCGNDGQRSVGSGNWDWPYQSDFRITQGYGHTCYSNSFYNGNPHPAYDMAGPKGVAIHAVEEGDAYTCRNCLGDGGNGVFIFHPNGKMTLYWHLQ